MTDSVFRPGANCAAVARAGRAAFLVDADAYFRALRAACEQAERSIVILGWDFDSRTPLPGPDGPVEIGRFLDDLARRRRHLRVHILCWDAPLLFGLDREPSPRGLFGRWRPRRRVRFRMDDTHPVGGAHHQKIVVVDGRLAFCGGLDLTSKRWDTRAHDADDPRRVWEGEPYPPFHDVQIAVDGEAARALAKVACDRWRDATGEALDLAPAGEGDRWPPDLPVHAADVRVALSCTFPETEDAPGVAHVERLYVDLVERARHTIYVENQYLTSKSVAAALKRSLARPDGPEVFIVTRLSSHGWLEENTMTALRTAIVRDLRAADAHGRLSVVYPHVRGLREGTCLDVHAKVMVVDDEWLRVGSSNLSNRSMGMDTECDVTLEAAGDGRVRAAIRAFRDGLVAEHSGCRPEDVARERARAGTIAGAVAALGSEARGLRRLETPDVSDLELAFARIGDPADPLFEAETPRARRPLPLRRVALALAGLAVAAALLALLWTRTPLADHLTRENAVALAERFAAQWWAPLLVVGAYTPASFVMFPRWVITMVAVVAFGPWHGFAYAMTGVLLAAVATFLPGRLVGPDRLRRAAGPRLRRVARFLERRGVLAVTAIRLVPVAPFPVVNFALAALRVKLGHFVPGTFLGMLPGMLAATVLSDQLAGVLTGAWRFDVRLVGAALLALAALAVAGRQIMRRSAA